MSQQKMIFTNNVKTRNPIGPKKCILENHIFTRFNLLILYFCKAYPLTFRPLSLHNKSSQASAVFTVVVVLEKDLMLKCVPAMLFLSIGASCWFGKHMGRIMSVKCPSSLRVGSSILLSSCNKATLYTDSGIKPWLGSVLYFG